MALYVISEFNAITGRRSLIGRHIVGGNRGTEFAIPLADFSFAAYCENFFDGGKFTTDGTKAKGKRYKQDTVLQIQEVVVISGMKFACTDVSGYWKIDEHYFEAENRTCYLLNHYYGDCSKDLQEGYKIGWKPSGYADVL